MTGLFADVALARLIARDVARYLAVRQGALAG